MKYPFEVKGETVNNEEELHSLVEIDLITSEEYYEILNQIEEEDKPKFTEPVKGERINWKKKCHAYEQQIYDMQEKIYELQKQVDEMKWQYSKYLDERFF